MFCLNLYSLSLTTIDEWSSFQQNINWLNYFLLSVRKSWKWNIHNSSVTLLTINCKWKVMWCCYINYKWTLLDKGNQKRGLWKQNQKKLYTVLYNTTLKMCISIDVQSDIGFLLAMPCHNFTSMVKSCDHLL